MDDVGAVLDAVGSERAAVLGVSEGGPMSILFAATYPERTIALLLYGAEVREEIDDEWPWGDMRRDEVEAYLAGIPGRWGEARNIEWLNPTTANEGWLRQWFGRLQAQSMSPGGMVAYYRTTFEIDVREVLPTVRVPTLVMHRREDHSLAVDNGRYIAAHIPGARYVELSGKDHVPWLSEADDVINEIQEQLTGSRGISEPDRVLTTVLFTDHACPPKRAAPPPRAPRRSVNRAGPGMARATSAGPESIWNGHGWPTFLPVQLWPRAVVPPRPLGEAR